MRPRQWYTLTEQPVVFSIRKLRQCLLVLIWICLSSLALCWLALVARGALRPPHQPHNFTQYRKTRELDYYASNIEVLIEPARVPEDPPLLVALVASAPSRAARRHAIRNTWATTILTTYFVIGVDEGREHLAHVYVEAKEYKDIIVFDMVEDFQNLTLKTMLILRWILRRCSHAIFFMKVEDDVLINPWTLELLLMDHQDKSLIGYKITNSKLSREVSDRRYVPSWLREEDRVPEYLSGVAYIIKVDQIANIYNKALELPLMNLEDVYVTYIVAKSGLGLTLTHDSRISPFKPWLRLDCLYWSKAVLNRISPDEMAYAWKALKQLFKYFEAEVDVCRFFNSYLNSDWWLH